MNYPIRILSDIKGYVVAVVEIDGTEYKVELHTIGMPTAERNALIRQMAEDMARESNNSQTTVK